MKHTTRFITLFIAAVPVMGCTSNNGKSTAGRDEGKVAAVKADAVKAETKEAAYAMRDYAYAQKETFVAQMKKDLAKIETDLDRLSAKVDKSRDAAKVEGKSQLNAVRAKWTETKKKLDQAEIASQSTWDSVKDGFKASYGELKDSFDKTRQWVGEKIQS